MKFLCDRCKTRYSISDERVRGKILKIRCKNCSAVITVREGMTVAAPKVPDKSGAARMPVAPDPPEPPKPARPQPPPPPPPMVVEWYVSVDGEQHGPYDLEGAKTWVSKRAPGAELYCWSEGFDDWLPVEKVSHFRGLRQTLDSGLLGLDTVAEPVEKTPKPLFAEAMQQMAAEAPTLLEDENPFSPAYERKKRETATGGQPEHQLAIGEPASPIQPSYSGSQRPASMPPIGEDGPRISGLTMPETPRPEVLQPAQRHPLVIPLIAATVVLLIVLGVLLYLALGRSEGGSDEPVSRTGSRSASLARSIDDGPSASADRPAAAPDAGAAVETRERRGRRDPGDTSRTTAPSPAPEEPRAATYTAPSGEVDLSGVGRAEVRQGSLDPSDIAAVYRERQFSVNRCYENAIKDDPMLEVPKTTVTLTIDTSGEVTEVSIPALSGQWLGRCLVSSISRWRFPASTEGFSGRFPIVFRSR